MNSILFVCQSNICRSPALESTLRHLLAHKGLLEYFHIDSCGIGWLHVGKNADPQMFEAAKKIGVVIEHRAQQMQPRFFKEFEYILAVDREVLEQLLLAAPSPCSSKITLVTEFSQKFKEWDVPDPYYLGCEGFTQVMEIILDSCEGIIRHFA